VPTGTIQDHHGMGIGGDLAADLAEMMAPMIPPTACQPRRRTENPAASGNRRTARCSERAALSTQKLSRSTLSCFEQFHKICMFEAVDMSRLRRVVRPI
jgi:hypothetical protein